MRLVIAAAIALLTSLSGVAPAVAAQCDPPGGFDGWLDAFRREAVAAGISQKTLSSALSNISHDPRILGYDRNQKAFRLTFEEFSANRINLHRLQKGGNLLRQHATLLTRIEEQFGVPGPVLVAIWGLETDFGANSGNIPTIRALATLAHDCRRTELFQGELLSALRLVERGDLTPAEMRGAWAGELGQTQFLPTSYLRFAVDFDGNGKRDLIASVPDVLASTANYLKGYGWKAGQPWDLGEPNFEALLGWNKSQIYSRTIALFAQRLGQGK